MKVQERSQGYKNNRESQILIDRYFFVKRLYGTILHFESFRWPNRMSVIF